MGVENRLPLQAVLTGFPGLVSCCLGNGCTTGQLVAPIARRYSRVRETEAIIELCDSYTES
jgi:hypothetical protein